MSDPRDGTFTYRGSSADRLDRVLRAFRPQLSWAAVRDLVARGKVTVNGVVVGDAAFVVAPGAKVEVVMQRRSTVGAPPSLAPERLVHVDSQIVVVDKPAGVDTIPYVPKGARGGHPAAATLDALVGDATGRRVRVVHRLDRDTSGLLVFARTVEAETYLAQQLRRHAMHRRYLALVHGMPVAGTLRSWLVEDRGDGRRGASRDEAFGRRFGKEAITHVEIVERFSGAALIACRLETGRTHQIRIHLAEAGHMLLGERAYTRDHEGPALAAPRILLHAAELGFAHPVSGAAMRFASPLPQDMAVRLAELRAGEK